MSKKKMTGREVLEEALRECCSTYCDQYPRYEGKIDLGEDYERYMNNLIKRSKNPFQRYFNTVGRRVAGIAAAMLIAFSCSMTVKAVREPVVEFFTGVYEKIVEFFFSADSIANAPNTIEKVYTLGYIPDEYILKEYRYLGVCAESVWENQESNTIILTQDILNGIVTFDYENSNYNIMYVSGFKVAYIDKRGTKMLYWNSSEYAFTMSVSCELSLEECAILIESLTLMNNIE